MSSPYLPEKLLPVNFSQADTETWKSNDKNEQYKWERSSILVLEVEKIVEKKEMQRMQNDGRKEEWIKMDDEDSLEKKKKRELVAARRYLYSADEEFNNEQIIRSRGHYLFVIFLF